MQEPTIIAGPCSAESEEQMLSIAAGLDKSKVKIFRAGIWKPRTKPNCFEGVGAIGLKWLKKVKDTYGFPIITEVATPNHIELALEHDVDYLWIGARTTVSPFVIQELAEALKGTDKTIYIKNPINPDLELWIGAFERFKAMNVNNLAAIHRGFSTYKKAKYRNAPQWQIAMDFKNRMPDIPMISDPSHIAGRRDLIAEVSQQALNFGFDGLMIETHNNPDEAWSDAKQQITPQQLNQMLKDLHLRQPNDDTDTEFKQKLNAYRQEIDETDTHIMEQLSHRMDVARQIGELKKEHNVAVFQPQRWDVIREKAKERAEDLNLSHDFIDKLLKALHQESVSLQDSIMQKED